MDDVALNGNGINWKVFAFHLDCLQSAAICIQIAKTLSALGDSNCVKEEKCRNDGSTGIVYTGNLSVEKAEADVVVGPFILGAQENSTHFREGQRLLGLMAQGS